MYISIFNFSNMPTGGDMAVGGDKPQASVYRVRLPGVEAVCPINLALTNVEMEFCLSGLFAVPKIRHYN